MLPGRTGICLGLALASLAARAALGEPCSLHRIAEIPVTMVDLVPTVPAKVNGTDAVFIADSGAFHSFMWASAVRMLHLSTTFASISVSGVGGGESYGRMTMVEKFSFAGNEFKKVPFLVSDNSSDSQLVGLIGQNFFLNYDVEYDLANGIIRILRAHGDCSNTNLAYWASAKSLAYSRIDIDFATAEQPHTKAVVYVNGQAMHATFDTGASRSVLTRDAARRAGFAAGTPGVTTGGEWAGLGSNVGQSLIVPFDSFKIGNEDVQHTKLRVADLSLRGTDMLIGADFFLSHHILVASSQRKLYFTYNGGPVFNLSATPEAPAPGGESPPGGDAAAAETPRHDYGHLAEHAARDGTRPP